MTYPQQYYRDYLQLDKILDAQHEVSGEYGTPAHDETLFIITHQAYELWFKQIMHELESVCNIFSTPVIPEQNIATALHRLKRIGIIAAHLVQQIKIMETMTPQDFLEFRDYLSPASGFQSLQFRLLEIRLGLRNERRIPIGKTGYHQHMDERDREMALEAHSKQSLFELVEKWLERMPFVSSESYAFWEEYKNSVETLLEEQRNLLRSNPMLSHDDIQPQLAAIDAQTQNFEAVFVPERYQELLENGTRRLSLKATRAALFIALYRNYPLLQLPFRLLESLVEIDETLAQWRYAHALMVSRMIGSKIGTGGSLGHKYLVETSVKHKIFSDFADMNSFLLSRKHTPALPPEIADALRFAFES